MDTIFTDILSRTQIVLCSSLSDSVMSAIAFFTAALPGWSILCIIISTVRERGGGAGGGGKEKERNVGLLQTLNVVLQSRIELSHLFFFFLFNKIKYGKHNCLVASFLVLSHRHELDPRSEQGLDVIGCLGHCCEHSLCIF